MFIKLKKSIDLQPLYLNTKEISSVTTASQANGGGSRIFLIGEADPWYVIESVEEVMDRISHSDGAVEYNENKNQGWKTSEAVSAADTIEKLWNEVKAHRMRYGWVDSEDGGQHE